MKLIDLLAEAAVLGRTEMSTEPNDGRAGWARLSTETIEPVSKWLDGYVPFTTISGRILSRGTSSEVVSSISAATYLIARTVEHGAEAVSESFHRVMRGELVSHAQVVLMKGITSRSILKIGQGITIEPLAGLPDGMEKIVAQRYALEERQHGDTSEPTCIVMRIHSKPVYFDRPVEPFSVPPQIPLPFPSMKIPIDVISLIAGVIPVPIAIYCIVEELGWPTMNANGISRSYPVNDPIEIQPSQSVAMCQVSALLHSHRRGDALERSIERFQEAHNSSNDADGALNLGACLEILLMHGEDSSNSEIGFKLRMRAAWLLGKDPADRKRIHDLIRTAYELRSIAAHQGTLPQPKSVAELDKRNENLRNISSLCQDLILKILKDGWPNWSDLVLQTEKQR